MSCLVEGLNSLAESCEWWMITQNSLGPDLRVKQIAALSAVVLRLSGKAGLRTAPVVVVSSRERFMNINVFSNRISVGENFLGLWSNGEFDEVDVEAVLAHEIGHLIDLRQGSRSVSFRNVILESAWLVCGLVPLLLYLAFPSVTGFGLSVGFALFWGVSIPWLVRRFEMKIEFEADQSAAKFLVEPKQLGDALSKIKVLSNDDDVALSGKLRVVAGMLTHPSFDERISRLVKFSKNSKPN